MDKKACEVKKKGILLWVLFLGVVFVSGCETAKGATYAVGATAEGIGAIARGVAKDTVNLWQAILKLDSWIQKNLW